MTAAPEESKKEQDGRFEREALPWMDDVYRFAKWLTRNDADADDLVQETYLRAYRSWHTFQPGSDARRWLFTICRNVYLRNRERERRIVDTGGDDAKLETLAAVQSHADLASHSWDDVFGAVDLGPAIERAISELGEPYRSTVLLVDVDGQSYEEAASILDVPVGTIRSRLFRGRRLLQEALLAHARDSGMLPSGDGRHGS